MADTGASNSAFTFCGCKGPQRRANCSTDRAQGLPCRTSGSRQIVDFEGPSDEFGFRREGCTCFIVAGGTLYSLCETHEAEHQARPSQFGAGLDDGKWIIDREIKR